ncbi:Ganglioside-induced differentiation-associated protein 2 [Phytophthora pseudosyringae]|uniref:Ganglioside-induced differentiation-associated protein 2 n=1 Tax=Phytophthora pseudosyringae TaxID=221518 RepID=A0A8T1V280_9STRA|nr:Ganglioside-induced differentiation-associated protein 2 [Phytophthora pseudosyringae]
MTPQASRGLEIWAVEGVAHSILFYLDLSTLDALLHVIQATDELRGYLKDDPLWAALTNAHFGGPQDSELAVEALPFQGRDWEWTSRERACVQLQGFLQSLDDRGRFDGAVTVVEGDVEHVNDIAGQPLDGIVFPTNPHLTNHHVGAAAAVFRRAGRGLEEFVSDPSFRGARPVGSVVVTPAFDTGVAKLIHCVGPNITMTRCYEVLGQTYENAMDAVLRENLQCVVMASVSTGSLGVSPKEGAQVAMRAIKKFLVRSDWRGKLAIVCNEEHVRQAFASAKRAALKDFNVLSPLPDNDVADQWLR